jgi:hypothetical protein
MSRGWGMKNVAILIALLVLSAPFAVLAVQVNCKGRNVIAIAEKEADCQAACDAVDIGGLFFESIGLPRPEGVTIILFKELPENGQHNSIGCYDSRNNEIRVLNFEAALYASQQSPPLRVSMNMAIWRSYVIHELAHASCQKEFAQGFSICTSTEYIACVAQLATLLNKEREAILANYSELSGFDNSSEITTTFYALDPGSFSVNAYLHYSKPENGPQFIKKLLRAGLPDESN